MKKLKKLAILLLAGVMMLTMLTACSGGGEKSLGAQFADAYLAYINKYRSSDKPKLTNNAQLRAMAKQALDAIDPKTDKIDAQKYSSAQSAAASQNVYVSIMNSSLLDDDDDDTQKAYVLTAEEVEALKSMLDQEDGDMQAGDSDHIEAIGAAWRTANGKTYFALAVRGVGE